MGLHLCPIEPSDWSDGPDGPEGKPCPDCGGSGLFNREECCIDGLYYPAIIDGTCESCEGSGVIPYDDSDYQPEMDDVL